MIHALDVLQFIFWWIVLLLSVFVCTDKIAVKLEEKVERTLGVFLRRAWVMYLE